jgi:hypothetical protein
MGGEHHAVMMIDYLNGLLVVLVALAVATVAVGATGIALLTTARCAVGRPPPRTLR